MQSGVGVRFWEFGAAIGAGVRASAGIEFRLHTAIDVARYVM
jgi:hypothetical protein